MSAHFRIVRRHEITQDVLGVPVTFHSMARGKTYFHPNASHVESFEFTDGGREYWGELVRERGPAGYVVVSIIRTRNARTGGGVLIRESAMAGWRTALATAMRGHVRAFADSDGATIVEADAAPSDAQAEIAAHEVEMAAEASDPRNAPRYVFLVYVAADGRKLLCEGGVYSDAPSGDYASNTLERAAEDAAGHNGASLDCTAYKVLETAQDVVIDAHVRDSLEAWQVQAAVASGAVFAAVMVANTRRAIYWRGPSGRFIATGPDVTCEVAGEMLADGRGYTLLAGLMRLKGEDAATVREVTQRLEAAPAAESFEAVGWVRKEGALGVFSQKWLTVPTNDTGAAIAAFRAIGYETERVIILTQAEAAETAGRL